METESWIDNYLQPISLGAEDAEMPKMQLYKDVSYLRIQPDEGTLNHESRNQFTFTNRNLDIIQNLHEAYIEYTLSLTSTKLDAMSTPPTAAQLQAVFDEFFPRVNITHTDGNADGDYNDDYEHPAIDSSKFFATCLPQTAFWIDGFDFMLNDTTISTQNSGLARSLNVLNHGKYAKESRQLSAYGMTFPKSIFDEEKSPFELVKCQLINKQMRLKVPLKYIVPYLQTNKVSWGVKTSLKLTKLNSNEINKMFSVIPGEPEWKATLDADKKFGVQIKDIELVVPYVKLENNKQLSLWNQMYSSVNNRYWLDNDLFTSSVYDNTIGHTNEVYRIATKGLNSRPRWLLLSALDPDCYLKVNAWKSPWTPMGFSEWEGPEGKNLDRYNAGFWGLNENVIKFTKLRVKINGIYIDGGSPLEFTNKPTDSADVSTMGKASFGGDYLLAYENYCKFFGSYHSKRATPLDFEEWLQTQVFAFDLVNIDSENIFANSGNALIIEVEFSTVAGAWDKHVIMNTTTDSTAEGYRLYNQQADGNPYGKFKICANVLYDKQLSVSHANNSAILTVT